MSVRLTPSAHPWPSFCRSEGPVGWGTHFHVDCRTSCFVRSTALTIGGSVPTRPTKWDSRGQRRVLKFPLQQDSDTVSLCAHSNARAAKPSTHNTKETQKQDTKKTANGLTHPRSVCCIATTTQPPPSHVTTHSEVHHHLRHHFPCHHLLHGGLTLATDHHQTPHQTCPRTQDPLHHKHRTKYTSTTQASKPINQHMCKQPNAFVHRRTRKETLRWMDKPTDGLTDWRTD